MADVTLVIKARNEAQAALNAVKGDLQSLAQAAQGVGGQLKQAGKALTGAGVGISAGITAPVTAIGTAALLSAADFEQAMNVMQQVSGATEGQMASLQAQALQLGAETSFSAGEVAQAMLELSKAGLSAAEVSAAIGGTLDLAAAGNLDLAMAAEITANAVNAFGLEASQANSVANLLAAAANASSVEVTDLAYGMQMAGAVFSSSGQSLETLNIALALLGNNGMKGSDAGTSLKTMLMSLTAPTDTAAKQLQALGVSVYDAAGNMRALPDVMNDLQSALYGTHAVTVTSSNLTAEQAERMSYLQKTIESTQRKLADYKAGIAGVAQSENDKVVAVDRLNRVLAAAQAEYASLASIGGTTSTVMRTLTEAQRNQALTAIFGSDAIRAANILLKEGTTGWQEMAAALGNETAAADVANARMKGISGAIEYVKGSIDSFLIGTMLPFADSISGALRAVGDMVTAFGQLPEPVKNAALGFTLAAAAIGPLLIGLGMATSAVGAALPVLAALAGPVGLVIAAVAALGAAWYFNWGGIQQITASALAAVQPTLAAIGSAIALVVSYLTATVETGDDRSAFGYIRKLPEWLQEPTLAIGQFVVQAGIAWSQFVASGASVVAWLQSLLPTAISAATAAWNQLPSALTAIQSGFSWLLAQGAILVGWLQSLLPGAIATATAAWNQLPGVLTQTQATLTTAFTGLVTAIQPIAAQVGAILAPAVERVKEAFGGIGASVGQLTPSFEGLLAAVQNMGNTLLPIVQALATALGVTLVVAASVGVNLISSALNRLPGIVGPIIDQVALTINTLSATVSAVAGAITAAASGDWAAAWESLKGVVTAFEEFLSGTWTNVTTMLGNVGAAIGEAVTNTLNDLGLTAAAETVQTIIGAIAQLQTDIAALSVSEVLAPLLNWKWPEFPTIPDVVSSLISFKWPDFPALPSILDSLVAWKWPGFPSMPSWLDRLLSWSWPTPPDILGGAGQAVNDAGNWVQEQTGGLLGGLLGNKQLGTSYAVGGWSWVGEAGPELVRLPRGAEVVPNRRAEKMAMGGVSVTIQQANIRSEMDIYDVAYKVRDLIVRQG